MCVCVCVCVCVCIKERLTKRYGEREREREWGRERVFYGRVFLVRRYFIRWISFVKKNFHKYLMKTFADRVFKLFQTISGVSFSSHSSFNSFSKGSRSCKSPNNGKLNDKLSKRSPL